jgi:hypothetical protein
LAALLAGGASLSSIGGGEGREEGNSELHHLGGSKGFLGAENAMIWISKVVPSRRLTEDPGKSDWVCSKNGTSED